MQFTDSGPVDHLYDVVPSDTTILVRTVAIYVKVAGSLVIQAVNSPAAVTIPVVAGQILPVRVQKVMAATTATVCGMGR